MSYAALSIEASALYQRDRAEEVVDQELLTLARRELTNRLRGPIGAIIDGAGVTESVFFDRLSALAATHDAYLLLRDLLTKEYLYRVLLRDHVDRAGRGEGPGRRAEAMRRELDRDAGGLRGLVVRAIAQGELTFPTTTRTATEDAPIYAIG